MAQANPELIDDDRPRHTARERNDRLAHLLTNEKPGRRHIAEIRRVDEGDTHGWEFTYRADSN